MQMQSKFWKKIFLIGCGLLVFGSLFVIFLLDYHSKSGPETDSVLIIRNQIIFYSIFVGLGMLIFGYKKMPKRIKSGKEKKLLKIIGWSVFLIYFAVIFGIISYYSIECLEVKENFENNSEQAKEKYGFDTFEQWLKEGATGNYLSNCFPDIDLTHFNLG